MAKKYLFPRDDQFCSVDGAMNKLLDRDMVIFVCYYHWIEQQRSHANLLIAQNFSTQAGKKSMHFLFLFPCAQQPTDSFYFQVSSVSSTPTDSA